MHALDVLGEPVRRRILELLGAGEMPAGGVATALTDELGLYRIDRGRLAEASVWFDQFQDPWQQPLDALETELARGRRERREPADARGERPAGQVD